MIRELRRRLQWFLTTDCDTHDPVTARTAKTVMFVILFIIILGALNA